ncbi:hypothetical protein BDV98DRAFT_558090 [Pterulicium gracile]|uniref:Uncharacterized protein n=1 Tax=Pterulicium gracile TaxID=1884261 RepID=A0A5C3R027_9AGAR|nr:hypothetical protein BDV98DRAFT_558090 [Pterula gracilis]
MPPSIIFSPDVRNMDEWAHRTHIPLALNAADFGQTYARAHRWLSHIRTQLVQQHNWTEVPVRDSRILYSLQTKSIWRSSAGLPAGPNLRLELPVHASSFFSPERRVQWQMVFHSDIFESVRKLCPPINDLLCLIQCLLTGLVTVTFDENLPQGVHRTTRGLPPASWIDANHQALSQIFSSSHLRALQRACSDTKSSYKLEVVQSHGRR